ncbi:Transmembrane domain-containing protein [Spironucleus salmonicida]|uniref:Transmembrane domain-containing protein n=1 Tax=Spironucleus salmonicida TaxID=348837 RepID=A0A9P8RZ04_9EUKA|nr:Transmembrane domain-containing protein [Spironucleus salmonicida]
MWKAQASIRSVLFLINYDIATSLGPDHQLALSRHPDSHTLADLALAKLILRVVVTIQNSSIPMLLSQAAYRVRLQSIMFDRLCIMRVLKIKYKQSSAQPVLALLVRIPFLVYCAPGLISEYILVSIVVYYINTIVIYQISLQAPLPMHIYYQTPIKLLLYILQYCILIKHYPSTTHAYLSTIYGNTWGPVLVVPTSVADSYQRQNTNSLRHSLCLYSTGKNTLPSVLCTWAHK